LHRELETAIKSAEQIDRDAKAGIVDLFGGIESDKDLYTESPGQVLSFIKTLQNEKESLGLFLSGHPMDVYTEEICSLCPKTLDQLESGKKRQWIAGVASNIRFMQSKQGKPICFFALSDNRASIEASVPPECYEKCASTIRDGDILLVESEIQPDRFTNGLVARVQNVISIDEYREKFIHSVVIHVDKKSWGSGLVDALKENIDFAGVMQGRHRLSLLYDDGLHETTISLGENWGFDLSDDLLFSLRSAFGQDNVKLNYVNIKSN
jgi:DNA polymerase-3 subunit alpha